MKKKSINIFLNILLFLALCYTAYSWMITDPSRGEIIDYDRTLIITTANISVDFYVMVDNEYVLQTDPILDFGLVEPGIPQRYRFDITNNTAGTASVKILFSDITGDITELNNFMIFGGTNPYQYSFKLGDKIIYNNQTSENYFEFYNKLTIPSLETFSLYWYGLIDKSASNDLMNKGLHIAEIIFMQS